MFYAFSIIALLCWSGSDFFSKKGTREQDKNSHWKVVFAVGLIMGIHFFITLIGGAIINNNGGPASVPKLVSSLFYTDFEMMDFVHYLPIAGVYILAMVFGYIGLRYIELSISSPICNSSGTLAFVLCYLFGIYSLRDEKGELTFNALTIIGVVLVAVGIIALGFIDQREDPEIKKARQEAANRKYTKSILALLLPISYLVIDALGTVGDEYVAKTKAFEITEYAANSAFELTFFILAIFAFVWVKFVKKEEIFKSNGALYMGGLCETVGQIFYMAVMFSEFSVGMVIISAYCAISVLWSRIFLKEKLSWKHYAVIAMVVAGIVILGD